MKCTSESYTCSEVHFFWRKRAEIQKLLARIQGSSYTEYARTSVGLRRNSKKYRKYTASITEFVENFFERLKVEMFYGEKFDSANAFIERLKSYIDYYNNERISVKLKEMSPVQYRTHSVIT